MSNPTSSMARPVSGRIKSDIFIKHFDKVTLPSNDFQAICKYCSKVYKWQQRGGYDTLTPHMEKNNPLEIGVDHSQTQISTFSSQTRVKLLQVLVITGLFTREVVSSQSLVESLPGFAGKLPFSLETGYIGVGEWEEHQLFYYFIESEADPKNDPLVLWLCGGPGCSGLWSIVFENGPIMLDYDNAEGEVPALLRNPNSWTKVLNILYVDQPVGSGFSYAKTPKAYPSSDSLSAATTYEFLKKWLVNHPKFLDNPLYIGGASYIGISVPLVVDHIYNGIDIGSEPVLNLKGYILGNPVTDHYKEANERISYAHAMGLLSKKLYQSAKENCNGYYVGASSEYNVLCKNDLKKVAMCLEKITRSNILEPWCNPLYLKKRDLLSQVMDADEEGHDILSSISLNTKRWCRAETYAIAERWANHKSVQKALHVREGTVTKWVHCNSSLYYTFGVNQTDSYNYDVQNTVDYHRKVTNKASRVLVYSGDHDLIIPHTTTEEWIDSLNVTVQSYWRPWFIKGQVAGFTMTYSRLGYNLTYATFKGAGHIVPEYQPSQCFEMIKRWFSNTIL